MADYSSSETLKFLEEHFDGYLQDLEEIVRIDCGTHNKAGVDDVGKWVANRMEEWGWRVQRHPQIDVGDCWSGSMEGSGSARLILITHLDTVYEDGTAGKRQMRIEGGNIFGPGTSDMKSGLLSAMWAMRAVQLQGVTGFDEIVLYCNSDEETGSVYGCELLTAFARKCDAAFVLEAGRLNGDIVSSRKGIGVYTIKVHGRSAHSGMEFHKGANAIVELAHKIIAASSLTGIDPGVTVNIGSVRGGTTWNVVPDFAEAIVEVRAVDCDGLDAVDKRLHQFSETATVDGTRIEIDGRLWPAMPKTKGAELLVELAQAAGRDVGLRIKDNKEIVGGVSDANYVAATGVPVIDGLGPVGGGDHSPGEFVVADSIVPRTAMLAGLLVRACRESERLRVVRSPAHLTANHFRVSSKPNQVPNDKS
jgi:glutamate carboxypeptidase